MSRRSVTTATFALELRLPPGAKIPDTVQFIRAALADMKKHTPHPAPMAAIDLDSITIALTKRETAYL